MQETNLHLENYDNKVGQVFALFSMFLYTVLYDSPNDRMLHNIFTDSRRIYMRALMDFFSEKKAYPDDLNYQDFIDTTDSFRIVVASNNTRDLASKQTAHATKKRGTFVVDDAEHTSITKQLIKQINHFIKELDQSIKDLYKQDYADKTAQELRGVVLAQIAKICLVNASAGEIIDL